MSCTLKKKKDYAKSDHCKLFCRKSNVLPPVRALLTFSKMHHIHTSPFIVNMCESIIFPLKSYKCFLSWHQALLVTFFFPFSLLFWLFDYHSIFHPTVASPAAFSERASVNGKLMVCFVKVVGNDEFQSRIHVWALDSKEFLEWVRATDAAADRKVVRVLTNKASRWGQGKGGTAREVKKTMLKEGKDVVLLDLCTEQLRQILLHVESDLLVPYQCVWTTTDARGNFRCPEIWIGKQKNHQYLTAAVPRKAMPCRIFERLQIPAVRCTNF